MSDRIARAFNKSGTTQVVAFDISKAMIHQELNILVFFTGLMKFLVRCLALFLLFSVVGSFA